MFRSLGQKPGFLPAADLTARSQLAQKANIAQEAWIAPTLLNGATGSIKYRKNQFGRLEFSSSIVPVSGGNPNLTLSTGYRPANDTVISINATDGTAGWIKIFINGDIINASALAGKTVSVNAVSVNI